MKKLIMLTFALFLTAGMAYGQVDISITQSDGNNNDAIATMDGAGNVNNALITIDQAGSQNDAYSDQVMNNYSGNYESSITQTGNSNYSDQFIGSSGHVTATITQVGNNNDAWQNISGTYTFYSTQSVDASITQEKGDNNDARQVVSGLNLELIIHQEGSGNYALQDIKHANGFEPTVTYTTDQHGNNNDAWMTAWGDTEGLLISQSGNLNDAVMTVGVNGAGATIIQNGNGNYGVASIL